ncbi:MAG: AAA family ATPase [Candidatus Marinimicrobia bacterium]|nr:AAA family ATPase [Candidatus Neomarinimicrobiota bacterium]
MYLKSLKLDGFKSFAKSTTLEFPYGTSAIVGPNGSGKSNVTEAIAWALGEQSVKNLRGKKGEDFIFNGSSFTGKKNKASVMLCFGGLKNTANDSSLRQEDEILICRVIHRDGTSEYRLNDSRCKLKDISDFLSREGVITSKHHIVSQNEADKMLSTSPVERRKIIEDALGLKVYQLKKEESERKLKRAEDNMSQTEALRREVRPHLNFLKKQFDKAQKLVEFKDQLKETCSLYFSQIYNQSQKETEKIKNQQQQEEKNVAKIESDLSKKNAYLSGFISKKKEEQKLREKIIFFEREIGRQEGILSHLQGVSQKKESKKEKVLFVSVKKLKSFVDFLNGKIETILNEKNLSNILKITKEIKQKTSQLFDNCEQQKNIETEDMGEKVKEAEELIKKLAIDLEKTQKEEQQLIKESEALRKSEIDLYRLENDLDNRKRNVKNLKEQASLIQSNKDQAMSYQLEIENILGEKIFTEIKSTSGGEADSNINKPNKSFFEWREQKRREIERLLVKIEEGSSVGKEIVKEYEEVKSRDDFLASQIEDLRETVDSLKKLIVQLKRKLDTDFKEGILKISTKFQEFFVLMFGGGNAVLKLQTLRRCRKEDDECEEEGVDLEVKLPRKGSYSLSMLSGGEKALTSIALLFAMSQINPPPFLILDETDTALDESNSRKYAKMLKNLGENTQLILITHNRETMSAADVLYGVTMDSDSVSRVLSVKLQEAENLID